MKANDTILNFLLPMICLIGICLGCRGLTSPPRPEDRVIRLDKREPSPIAKKDGNFKLGDQVVIVENDGKLSFDSVKGIRGESVLVRSKFGGAKKWVPSENGRPLSLISTDEEIEKISPKNYIFEYGSRRKEYKYFPSEQIFLAPWANNINLKVGDVVYSLSNKYRYLEKGIVTEAPVGLPDAFYVRFGDKTDSTRVTADEVCSSIEPAKPEDLSPGTFAHYDNSRWVMIVGRRDGKIIIRQINWTWDEVVDISKLQIVR